jgi:hypothetical protein
MGDEINAITKRLQRWQDGERAARSRFLVLPRGAVHHAWLTLSGPLQA